MLASVDDTPSAVCLPLVGLFSDSLFYLSLTRAVPVRPWAEGGKRTFFIVNTVPLVEQQARAIEQHTDLTVGQFVGSATLDAWKKEDWEVHLEKNQVRLSCGRRVTAGQIVG